MTGEASAARPPAPPAAAAVDEALRRAYEEGFAKGGAEARVKAVEEARRIAQLQAQREAVDLEKRAAQLAMEMSEQALTACRQQADALDSLLRALPAQLDQRLDAAEDDMLALCFETVCRVLGEQALQPEAVRAHLSHAVRALRGRQLLVVRLHPEDLAFVTQGPSVLGDARPGEGSVRWRPDPSVALGGCILESSEGGLDARFDTQLQALRDLLHQSRAAARAAEV